VIGIAAVILMMSIGQGAQGYILNQVADLGADLVFVEPASGEPTNGPPNPFIEQTMTLDDAKAMQASGRFYAVSPVVISTATVSRDDTTLFSQIDGLTPEYLEVFPAEIRSGRPLDQSDVDTYASVAVLGSEMAEDLFGDQDPVGLDIKIKQRTFRVIGVFEPQGTRFFQNLDQRVGIPVTTAQRDIFGVDSVNYIAARAIGDIEDAKEELRFLLRDIHKIDNPSGDAELDDFFVSSQGDAVEIVGTVGNVLTMLLASIAAISLFVGGIGIMNIMLVSVTERVKEIGLRKAVGATRQDILRQFLTEAVALTALGGLMGVVIGSGVSWLVALVVRQFVDGWAFILPPEGILASVAVAAAVGIAFGVYPARRAAALDPIAALRYE
jgi:putative ABC transport system permease protein